MKPSSFGGFDALQQLEVVLATEAPLLLGYYQVMLICLPPQGTPPPPPPPNTAAYMAHSTHSTQPALRVNPKFAQVPAAKPIYP